MTANQHQGKTGVDKMTDDTQPQAESIIRDPEDNIQVPAEPVQEQPTNDGQDQEEKITDFDQIISAMNVYQDEWIYRDSMFWKHAFAFFYASIIVTLLPNLSSIGLDITAMKIPACIYPVIGAFIAGLFIYLACSDAERSKKASDSYKKVMNMLPEKFQRETIDKAQYNKRSGFIMAWIMFAGLMILCFVCFFLYIK